MTPEGPGGPASPRVLSRGASGLRHLRWAREVLGTLAGLVSYPEPLSEQQRLTLAEEIERVTALVAALSGAVKPYRDFLERTRTLARGRVRAAELLAGGALGGGALKDGAPGSGARGTLEEGAGARWLAAARFEMADVIEPERQRLHAALAEAIEATRAGLAEMEEHLSACFPADLVAGVYPALTTDGTRVLDDGDPDDDAAGS